ncbi:hypothetical protein Patl1_24456 [Pistacia atlantica]|uniref:Uncharacterized protein n=1 Tax=Pistacia atlantica TaxID=434234 RepID=A0ACC1A2A6_9ROSI|nr:hypothetical protein Patl1_24456 [Pistacia atlantica]
MLKRYDSCQVCSSIWLCGFSLKLIQTSRINHACPLPSVLRRRSRLLNRRQSRSFLSSQIVVTESVRQLSAKLVSNDVDTLQADQKLKIVVFDWALGGRWIQCDLRTLGDEQVTSQQEERCSAGTQ